jgi:hypothetical protein
MAEGFVEGARAGLTCMRAAIFMFSVMISQKEIMQAPTTLLFNIYIIDCIRWSICKLGKIVNSYMLPINRTSAFASFLEKKKNQCAAVSGKLLV